MLEWKVQHQGQKITAQRGVLWVWFSTTDRGHFGTERSIGTLLFSTKDSGHQDTRKPCRLARGWESRSRIDLGR